MTSKPQVFLRESTGLVKTASLLDTISLNISNMSVGTALATISFTMLAVNVSGLNLVLSAVFAFVLSLPQVVVYTMMTRRMPRTGGDYVWVSRSLGGFWGSSLSFMGYTLETLAFLALIAIAGVEAIGSVGLFFDSSSQAYFNLAVPPGPSGGSASYQFVVAVAIFALLIAVNIFKPRAGFKLVTVFAMFSVAMLVIGILTLFAAGQHGVETYVNSLPNTSYSQIASSYQGSSFSFGPTIFLLPFFAMFVFPWLNAGPAVGSEIKGKKAVGWNIPISAFIAFVLITSAFGAMYYAGGLPFINAALNNSNLVTFYSFNFWTLAMGVTNVVALQYLIGFGWIVWNLAVLAYGIIIFSRYIFAQSFDRFLPTRLATVNARYGSPVAAHLLDLIITVVLIGFASFLYGSFSSLYAATVAAMIYYVAVGLAAIIYARKHESGSKSGILTLAGLLMVGVFMFIIYQYFTNPSIWGTANTFMHVPGYYLAYAYAAGSFIAGAVIYLVSKSRHAAQGIDISLAYKEIPPE